MAFDGVAFVGVVVSVAVGVCVVVALLVLMTPVARLVCIRWVDRWTRLVVV